MSRSRFGTTLATVALAVGAGIVTFAVHRVITVPPEVDSGDRGRTLPAAAMAESASERRANGEAVGGDRATVGTRPSGPSDLSGAGSVGAAPGAAGAKPAERAGRAAHADALRHPSASFRDTSLLALIRGAGYVCRDIVSSAAGRGDAGTWRVSCDDAQAFLVYEDDGGEIKVDPMPFIESLPLPPQPRTPGQPPVRLPDQ